MAKYLLKIHSRKANLNWENPRWSCEWDRPLHYGENPTSGTLKLTFNLNDENFNLDEFTRNFFDDNMNIDVLNFRGQNIYFNQCDFMNHDNIENMFIYVYHFNNVLITRQNYFTNASESFKDILNQVIGEL